MIALDWAKQLGCRSSESYYKALAVAILVESLGVSETAKHLGESEGFVKQWLEVHKIASMPGIEIRPADLARYLRKLLALYPIYVLAARLGRSVAQIEQILKENPDAGDSKRVAQDSKPTGEGPGASVVGREP